MPAETTMSAETYSPQAAQSVSPAIEGETVYNAPMTGSVGGCCGGTPTSTYYAPTLLGSSDLLGSACLFGSPNLLSTEFRFGIPKPRHHPTGSAFAFTAQQLMLR